MVLMCWSETLSYLVLVFVMSAARLVTFICYHYPLCFGRLNCNDAGQSVEGRSGFEQFGDEYKGTAANRCIPAVSKRQRLRGVLKVESLPSPI